MANTNFSKRKHLNNAEMINNHWPEKGKCLETSNRSALWAHQSYAILNVFTLSVPGFREFSLQLKWTKTNRPNKAPGSGYLEIFLSWKERIERKFNFMLGHGRSSNYFRKWNAIKVEKEKGESRIKVKEESFWRARKWCSSYP